MTRAEGTPTTLVAHSLGCLTAASWLVGQGPGPVVGALLVAVPDPSGPVFPAAATAGGFRTVRRRLPVPVTVVASNDDPYATPEWTRELAATWGAELIEIGGAGHLNDASGLGTWPEGRRILRGLMRRTGAAATRSCGAAPACTRPV
ncbi:RBBP9/YdeN family alpha/beta hydrolase [Myceligenerans indicum]|uniref:Alpha/beta hydrolase n=1 Tax=Myceligenerans indicum TaxID=2593663 RepID=A0ABS1LLM6_9MICO|nr:hypothetical protein [Myceligenerans indicum]